MLCLAVPRISPTRLLTLVGSTPDSSSGRLGTSGRPGWDRRPPRRGMVSVAAVSIPADLGGPTERGGGETDGALRIGVRAQSSAPSGGMASTMRAVAASATASSLMSSTHPMGTARRSDESPSAAMTK